MLILVTGHDHNVVHSRPHWYVAISTSFVYNLTGAPVTTAHHQSVTLLKVNTPLPIHFIMTNVLLRS
jgi:hypothetical protein